MKTEVAITYFSSKFDSFYKLYYNKLNLIPSIIYELENDVGSKKEKKETPNLMVNLAMCSFP